LHGYYPPEAASGIQRRTQRDPIDERQVLGYRPLQTRPEIFADGGGRQCSFTGRGLLSEPPAYRWAIASNGDHASPLSRSKRLKPGDQIRDYILEQRIGSGGVGEVWRARHIRLNKPVAIKAILPHLCQDENIYSRFVQEATATASIEHPHIISVHDFFSVGDDAFLVMSYVQGGSLQDRIRKRGRLPLSEMLHISSGILDALDFAHKKGIVHRDVKPSNILLSPESHAYLVDFGIALVLGKTRITRFGANIGTPDYMSPEQIRGEPLDHRTDVYSFGCVLYESLTGRSPFRRSEDDTEFTLMERHMHEAATPIRSAGSTVNAQTEAVIMRALEKDREQRFAGCADMAKALQAAAASSSGIPSGPVLSVPMGLKAAVVVLALTTIIGFSGWIAGSGEKDPGDSALRKELADVIAGKEKSERELRDARTQLTAREGSGNAALAELRKELQAAKATVAKAQQESDYWKDQAAKERAGSGQSGDARAAKLQKELQTVNASKESALKEANHWKEQAGKLQNEVQESRSAQERAIKEVKQLRQQLTSVKEREPPVKKPPPYAGKPTQEIARHLGIAKEQRERGAYDAALAELSVANSLDPGNAEIAAEIDKTKRACNAEKRLGRTELKC
jgi:eukaryotic-like serine/threonine-protein kinase